MQSSLSHQLGANRKEMARKTRTHDANFSQSRDIREDRGARQEKFVHRSQTTLPRVMRNARVREKRSALLLPERTLNSKRPDPVILKRNCPNAKSVTIAGTFNGWHPESIPLRRIQGDEWMVELGLPSGVYEYRFLVDGQWVDDPNARRHVSNGFGGQNSLLEIS